MYTISRRREALDVTPETEMTKELENIDLEIDRLPVERVLEMQWSVEMDQLQYNILIKDKRRNVKYNFCI